MRLSNHTSGFFNPNKIKLEITKKKKDREPRLMWYIALQQQTNKQRKTQGSTVPWGL